MFLSTVLLLSFCLCLRPVVVGAVSGWTYEETAATCAGTDINPCGPAYWSKVKGAGSCGLTSQSPVNIASASSSFNGSYPTFYAIDNGCDSWVQFSNNYTYEIGFIESKDNIYCQNLYLNFNQNDFYLAQIHFHSPSEHSIGGGYFAAEAHLVHVNPLTSQKLVVGVLMEESATIDMQPSNNSFLNTFWQAGGSFTLSGEEVIIEKRQSNANPSADLTSNLNPYTSFLPARTTQYQYNGSLTVPPCTENVQWILFDQPVLISQNDLSILRAAIAALPSNKLSSTGNSNRVPSQLLNNRTVIRVDPAITDMYNMLNSNINNNWNANSNNNDDDINSQAHEAVVLSASALTLSIFAAAFCLVMVNMTYRRWNFDSNRKADNTGNNKHALEMRSIVH